VNVRPTTPRLRALAFVMVLVGSLMLLPPASGMAAQTQAQSPSGQLQVWDLNTKHMGQDVGEPTDWRVFVDYITDPRFAPYYPDVVTLQEVGTRGPGQECWAFQAKLEERTGLRYGCRSTSNKGGTAVVFQRSKLAVRRGTFTAFRELEDRGTGRCVPVGDGSWTAVGVGLSERLTGKQVDVESIHLPTHPDHCYGQNVARAYRAFAAMDGGPEHPLVATTHVIAGDFNVSEAVTRGRGLGSSGAVFGGWSCWYRGVNERLATPKDCPSVPLKDAVYEACRQQRSYATDAALWSECIKGLDWKSTNLTVGDKHRIDFVLTDAAWVFASSTGTVPFCVASWAAKDDGSVRSQLRYSDHRAIGSLILEN
jgi:hypothetical protein